MDFKSVYKEAQQSYQAQAKLDFETSVRDLENHIYLKLAAYVKKEQKPDQLDINVVEFFSNSINSKDIFKITRTVSQNLTEQGVKHIEQSFMNHQSLEGFVSRITILFNV